MESVYSCLDFTDSKGYISSSVCEKVCICAWIRAYFWSSFISLFPPALNILTPIGLILMKFEIVFYFGKFGSEIQVSLKSDKMAVALLKDLLTLMLISGWIMLLMKHFADKILRKFKHICVNKFFTTIFSFSDNTIRHGKDGQATYTI